MRGLQPAQPETFWRRHRPVYKEHNCYTYLLMAEHLPSKIPSELADTIIDYLHDDSRALSSCSIVCKAWLVPRSRFHLFEHILLVEAPPFDLFDSPLSTIAPYVRYLNLQEGQGRYSYEPEWLNKALLRLAVLTTIKLCLGKFYPQNNKAVGTGEWWKKLQTTRNAK
jgi:hypothetical protein